MPCIKVGINEWILLNKQLNPIVLWTDGLIDCVAVTIITPERAFLTHINSAIAVNDWQTKVEAEFKETIKRFGNLDNAKCWITVSRDIEDEGKTDLTKAVEKTLTEVWAKSGSKSYVEVIDYRVGVRLSCDSSSQQTAGFAFEPLRYNGFGPDRGFDAKWGKLMNSMTGPEYIEAHGFFSSAHAETANISPDNDD